MAFIIHAICFQTMFKLLDEVVLICFWVFSYFWIEVKLLVETSSSEFSNLRFYFLQLFTGQKKQPVIVPMYAASLVSRLPPSPPHLLTFSPSQQLWTHFVWVTLVKVLRWLVSESISWWRENSFDNCLFFFSFSLSLDAQKQQSDVTLMRIF